MQHFCNSWRVRNLLVMVLRVNQSLKLAESIVSLQPHHTAQADHQLWSLYTVYTPFLACCRRCQRRPLSIAPTFHAIRSSPQTAGNLNISNYIILNTYKLHTSRIWLFAAHPNALSPLSVMNLTLPRIQSRTWTCFTTSNMLKASLTQSLNHCHLLSRRPKHIPALMLRWAIISLCRCKTTLRVAWRQRNKTKADTHLRPVKSTNVSRVGPRRQS